MYWKQSFNNAIKIGDKAGVNGKRHARVNLFGKRYMVHHIVWEMIKGKKPTQIDHINGNGLDNRIENLRDVSHQVNCQNKRSIGKQNTSGFLGVNWRKDRQKWRAVISTRRKQKFLGFFDTAQEAHQAYLIAKRKLHEGSTL